jgi:putative PIN family toxin of toxin-antitoxin system
MYSVVKNLTAIYLGRETELITINETIDICRDPKDNKFLELAISGKATHIITGDKDLLELHPFRLNC